MGTAYLDEKLDGNLTQAQVRKAFEDLRERARDEHGSRSYSGSWKEIDWLGFSTRAFKGLTEARDLLFDDVGKGSAVAVKVRDDQAGEPWKAPAVVAAWKARTEAEAAVTAHVRSVADRLKAAASKTKGCSGCGSSIAVAHLKVTCTPAGEPVVACPVCGKPDFPFSAGDAERKGRLLAAQGKAVAAGDAALEAEKAKSTKVVWLLVGAASC